VPLLKKILSSLFPPCCTICSAEGSLFCPTCQNYLDFLYFTPQLIPLNKLLENKKHLEIDIKILGFYTPPLSTAIKSYKYQGLFRLAPIFAELLYNHLIFPADIDIITAIPLHPKKKKQRGFDQTKLIIQELSQKTNKPFLPLLIKTKHTQNLASTKDQDTRNLLTENAFALNKKHQQNIARKHILLFDDVVTSGSTLAACIQVLITENPRKITLCALAHEG
jgi:competence protein ComFC